MDMQDKFEKYILGQMTEAEKFEFENELETNSLLKEQLELEQDIVQQIRNRAFVDEQIRTAKKEMQRGRTIRLVLYSVTSVAAIVILSIFLPALFTNPDFDQLYASNFTTYTNDYIITDGSSRGDMEIDSLLLAAMKAYEKQDYSMAETLFNQLLSANDNPEIRFYLAIAQLETAKTNEALNNLQLLYAQPETYRYYEPTRWYLALAHLKLHQKDEAGKYLEELVKLEGEYWDKAKELLARIK